MPSRLVGGDPRFRGDDQKLVAEFHSIIPVKTGKTVTLGPVPETRRRRTAGRGIVGCQAFVPKPTDKPLAVPSIGLLRRQPQDGRAHHDRINQHAVCAGPALVAGVAGQ